MLLWLFALAFALHEFEEWNIHLWYARHWTNVDPDQVNARTVHTFLLLAIALGTAWTFIAARFRKPRTALLLALFPFVLIVYPHAFAHVWWTLEFGAYAPGVVTAVLLIIPATLALAFVAIRDGLLPRWSLLLLLAAPAAAVGLVAFVGNELPASGLPWLRIVALLHEPTG